MMFKYVLILSFIGLAACAPSTQYIVKKEFVPLEVDDRFYNCPFVPKEQLPDPKTATRIQVAQTLADTRFNNEICFNSMNTLKHTIGEYKKRIEDAN